MLIKGYKKALPSYDLKAEICEKSSIDGPQYKQAIRIGNIIDVIIHERIISLILPFISFSLSTSKNQSTRISF
jgi:hypothetical protein